MRQNASEKVTRMTKALTIFVTLGLATCQASAHPLEDAAYQAMTLCARMDGIETLEQCGATVAPSPDRPAAKAALMRMFKARAAFMVACDNGRGTLERCQEQADLYVWAGISRDFKLTVQHLDQPAPQSARPR
jgi:hypothetical protein